MLENDDDIYICENVQNLRNNVEISSLHEVTRLEIQNALVVFFV